MKKTLQNRKDRESKTVSPSSESDDFSITKLNWKIYEGGKENQNVQVPENNNSSDKESNWEVSDFFSSEDSCDECLRN